MIQVSASVSGRRPEAGSRRVTGWRSILWTCFAVSVVSTVARAAAGKEAPAAGVVLLEGEGLRVGRHTGNVAPQDLRGFGEGAWSGNAHLWWTGAKPGEELEVLVPVAVAGTYRLGAGMTQAIDYGIFSFSLDGQPLEGSVDYFHDGVLHTGTRPLGGAVQLTAGEHRLGIKVIGANAKAIPGYMLGLDYLVLVPGATADWAAVGPRLNPPGRPAAAELKMGNAADVPPRTSIEQQAAFTVPPGFVIELVASEETGLPKPAMTVFDDAGRLWSVTATDYPRDNDPGIWTRPGNDRVVIIDQPCTPGPHAVRTFADGMVMPLSVLPYGRGAFVAQGPEILFLEDRDGDGRADTRSVRLRGFGVQDTHTLPHQLTRMPGGRIVYSQGVLNNGRVTDAGGRTIDFNKTQIATFRPDGTGHEVIGAGLNNIWAWAVSREGRVFIHEANDFGYSVVPFEEDSTYPSFILTKLHPATPMHPPTAPGLELGATGFSGLAIADDRAGSYPAPWHGLIYVSNPVLGRVHAVAMEQAANGVYSFKKAGDLVTCADPMFRPVAITFGPDGCLYITDWYNRIISHNEVARDHPGRDKTRGRIWRVRHQSQTQRRVPDLTRVATTELPAHLTADNTWEMRAAWHEIANRGARELAPALKTLIRDAQRGDDVRIQALWALEDTGNFDAVLWRELLAHANANVRREAVRAMSALKVPAAEAFTLVQSLAGETAWTVRYEVLRFFRRTGATAEQLAWLKRWSDGPAEQQKVEGWNGPYLALGGSYERAFQDHLWSRINDTTAAVADSDPRWDQILATQPARSSEATARIQAKIASVKAALVAAGDRPAEAGRVLVQTTCLACHRIGTKGVSLAPPLDGSASRDVDALITAIVDPDAAMENVFRLYRVELKNGMKVEGFRKSVDARQLTLMFMGGGTRSIPVAEIQNAGYVQGKSVMLPLAAGLSDGQVADVIRYLKSLK